MPKMSLLEMTQDILYSMGSDNVSSINDTYEATQVAHILKNVYFDIISRKKWRHLGTLLQLSSSGDIDFPTYMYIPDNVQSIEWIKYNKKESVSDDDKYEDVEYLEPKVFLDLCDSRSSSASNVVSITDPSNTTILVRDDQHPTYWTTFDDKTLIFDSYFSDLDDTLQTSKTKMWSFKEPSFTVGDTFIPDFPAEEFPYYLAEAKSVCFFEIAQEANQKEEQRSRRLKNYLHMNGWKAKGGIFTKDYGRK